MRTEKQKEKANSKITSCSFEYFYGIEANQFAFLRIPKILFSDEFKDLSLEAKVLYGLLLDRMSLSWQNQWVDDKKRVFVYYTVENICKDLNLSIPTCTAILQELDTKTGIGLIERVRQGMGKPAKIYVKNFVRKPQDDHQTQSF